MTRPITSQATYDGTAESRIRIRNWQRETFDDPGQPFRVYIGQDNEAPPLELQPGQTLQRFPDGSYGLVIEAGEPEG